jgi:hypothetical protein
MAAALPPHFPFIVGSAPNITGDEVCKTGPPQPYSATQPNVLIVGVRCSVLNGVFSFFKTAISVLGFTLLLGLKHGHTCDAIVVVAEFMVDVAGIETRPNV